MWSTNKLCEYLSEPTLILIMQACLDGVVEAFPSERKGKEQKSTIDAEPEVKSAPVDILVDIVIGLLEQSTSYTRVVANQVFSMLTGLVQESTIELIVTVSTVLEYDTAHADSP